MGIEESVRVEVQIELQAYRVGSTETWPHGRNIKRHKKRVTTWAQRPGHEVNDETGGVCAQLGCVKAR
jgi:hypothetical protein